MVMNVGKMYDSVFRHEKNELGGTTFKEKLRRKMQIKNILDNLELDYFLSTLMIWMRGRNVFIDEDCTIFNYGLVAVKPCLN